MQRSIHQHSLTTQDRICKSQLTMGTEISKYKGCTLKSCHKLNSFPQSPMAAAIFSLFAKKAASVIFGLVKDKAFGDASLKVKDLVNMQAALEATITTLVRESEIYEASQHIKAWTEQLRDKLDDAQRGYVFLAYHLLYT